MNNFSHYNIFVLIWIKSDLKIILVSIWIVLVFRLRIKMELVKEYEDFYEL